MSIKVILVAATSLAGSWAVVASAEDKTHEPSSAVSITGMTPQIFDNLPANAMVEVNGQRMTKQEFVTHRQSAIKQAEQKRRETYARVETEFQAQRKAFLASQKAKLKEANQKVQAEFDRAYAADAAAHGPNWEADKKRALKLLDQAAKASGQEQVQLVTQALDLLKPVSPQQHPTGPKP
jgi:hypothetical protein